MLYIYAHCYLCHVIIIILLLLYDIDICEDAAI